MLDQDMFAYMAIQWHSSTHASDWAGGTYGDGHVFFSAPIRFPLRAVTTGFIRLRSADCEVMWSTGDGSVLQVIHTAVDFRVC